MAMHTAISAWYDMSGASPGSLWGLALTHGRAHGRGLL